MIWNHHGRYIQIRTDMPGIDLVIREIAIQFVCHGNLFAAC